MANPKELRNVHFMNYDGSTIVFFLRYTIFFDEESQHTILGLCNYCNYASILMCECIYQEKYIVKH